MLQLALHLRRPQALNGVAGRQPWCCICARRAAHCGAQTAPAPAALLSNKRTGICVPACLPACLPAPVPSLCAAPSCHGSCGGHTCPSCATSCLFWAPKCSASAPLASSSAVRSLPPRRRFSGSAVCESRPGFPLGAGLHAPLPRSLPEPSSACQGVQTAAGAFWLPVHQPRAGVEREIPSQAHLHSAVRARSAAAAARRRPCMPARSSSSFRMRCHRPSCSQPAESTGAPQLRPRAGTWVPGAAGIIADLAELAEP